MHILQSLFYLTTALHVSGIIVTHLHEHKTTVTGMYIIHYSTEHTAFSAEYTLSTATLILI
jgi:hypothetical protein